ncbi:hypothetical protein FOA43_000145 [Brettanomyces nanus]|uniref:Uncharacterized protein n=1 Tax=Eeniella nana TaxID=13502 RepID=A0A875RWL0_EENNA|nr:uncharacterized protein FOA43_000145 [Brettanomyces nanus]QPG72843.1 hypothetical protein FOA43_000145 [Brettanomyces nanus]
MLFVTPNYYYQAYAPSGSCSLEVPVDRYRYEIEQRMRETELALNKPLVDTAEDSFNYYILLKKRNLEPYDDFEIRTFSSYEIRIAKHTLLIRSTADQYYDTFLLPADASNDIDYKLLNDGYSLLVVIPKEMKVKPFRKLCVGGEIPQLYWDAPYNVYSKNSEIFDRHDPQNMIQKVPEVAQGSSSGVVKVNIARKPMAKSKMDALSKGKVQKLAETSSDKMMKHPECMISVPISFSLPTLVEAPKKSATANEEEEEREANRSTTEEPEEPGKSDNSEYSEYSEEPAEPAEPEKDPLLKNYETLSRKTIFPPDTKDEEASTPTKVPKSPILEDLVDEEFA